jgi:hypothetical protein
MLSAADDKWSHESINIAILKEKLLKHIEELNAQKDKYDNRKVSTPVVATNTAK